MKVAIIGTGYVGLVAGACLAEAGHNVVCVDNNHSKIVGLRRGVIPIYEPGLSELVLKGAAEGRLDFTTSLREALVDSRAVFIAVGTPPRPGDGHADMKYVFAVAKEIAENASGDIVIIDKSTVPVGTGDEIEYIISASNPGFRFAVVSNPEFLREGAAISDFMRPDRIVIGSETMWAGDVVSDIYSPEIFGNPTILHTSRRSAELLKYAANAFLAMKITFINEIADLCEVTDANIRDVAIGLGLDNRIGEKFLKPGPGYGGSCFPKDTLAIAKTARDHRSQLRTVETIIQINEQRKRAMALKVADALGHDLRGKRIAVLGLAFKADTDDVRESPAIPLIRALQDFGAKISVFDPQAMDNSRQFLSDVTYGDSSYSIAEGADAVVIVTEWKEFRNIDLERLRGSMRNNVLIDLRNLFQKDDAIRAGFRYTDVGSPSASSRERLPLAAE